MLVALLLTAFLLHCGEGHLSATVDVLGLDDDGRLVLPAAVRRIWLEVGCNSRDTLTRLAHAPENADVLLVQFEPLLDKYSWLLSSPLDPQVRRAKSM